MPDFPNLPIITPPTGPKFPDLPIVTPDPPRATAAEKYGALYYLGIGGLIFSVLLVGSFAYGLWATRELWQAIHRLNNPKQDEASRIRAAWVVAHHRASNDRQKIDTALLKGLPDLARYIVAEGMTSDSIRADPKGYALMVDKSEGWPAWLRLALLRPMAYAVGEGYRIAWEPLDDLRQHPDAGIALWALYTRAAMEPGQPDLVVLLQNEANRPGAFRALAGLLAEAAKLDGDARVRKLDEATAWLRSDHPVVAPLWRGWTVRDGRIEATPADPGKLPAKNEANHRGAGSGKLASRIESNATRAAAAFSQILSGFREGFE